MDKEYRTYYGDEQDVGLDEVRQEINKLSEAVQSNIEPTVQENNIQSKVESTRVEPTLQENNVQSRVEPIREEPHSYREPDIRYYNNEPRDYDRHTYKEHEDRERAYRSSNPYVRPNEPYHVKPISPMVKKAGIVAACAVIFGATAFGTNYGLSKIVNKGSNETVATVQETNDADTIKDLNKGNIASTQVGAGATDLLDVSSIVKEVMPSIVAITNTGTVTYQNFFGQSKEYASESCGTGVIISQDDTYLYIVTNHHVVSGATELTIQFSDDSTVKGEIQGSDASDDLAVVKVKRKDIDKDTFSTIKVATTGKAEDIEVGDAAIAIGNALGYGQSVTTGIISALGRSVSSQDETTGQVITNDNLIQTDAAINPGNSGGALLNIHGEVIGINSVKYASTEVEGIGYAISIEDVEPIVVELIKNGDYERTQTAYLGIAGQDLSSDLANVYKMPTGVYIMEVYDGGAAANADLQCGDIITSVDGKKIETMNELQKALMKYQAGDKVVVEVSRQTGKGYESKKVDVVLTDKTVLPQEEETKEPKQPQQQVPQQQENPYYYDDTDLYDEFFNFGW